MSLLEIPDKVKFYYGYLNPMGLTQRALADAIHVPYQRINDLVNGRRSMTPGTALRLAKFFGNSAGFWMNLQLRWDLYFANKSEQKALDAIRPLEEGQTGISKEY